MGNKSSAARTNNTKGRTASTHDTRDISAESQAERDAENETRKQTVQVTEFLESVRNSDKSNQIRSTAEEQTNSVHLPEPPPCPGQGCNGCWVCDWD